MKHKETMVRWAVLWSQCNWLDGERESFRLFDWREVHGGMKLFRTRKACAEWIKQNWGYIARRADLQREPHCWRVPKPVRVTVTIGEIHARKRPRHHVRTLRARSRQG